MAPAVEMSRQTTDATRPDWGLTATTAASYNFTSKPEPLRGKPCSCLAGEVKNPRFTWSMIANTGGTCERCGWWSQPMTWELFPAVKPASTIMISPAWPITTSTPPSSPMKRTSSTMPVFATRAARGHGATTSTVESSSYKRTNPFEARSSIAGTTMPPTAGGVTTTASPVTCSTCWGIR